MRSVIRLSVRKVLLLLPLISLPGCFDEAPLFYSNVMRSDVYTQLYNDTKYDFLWVFDNSPTMQARRQIVMDNMNTFLNTLQSRKAIDYQMAVTTTDFFTHQGNLIKSPSGLEVVKSAASADPAADFNAIVGTIVDTGTSFWEQGLISAKEAIRNHGSKFLRPGVPLIIIVASDEDDASCEGMKDADGELVPGPCWGIQPEDNEDDVPYEVDYFIDYLSQVKRNEGTYVYLFPIVGLNTTDCARPSAGERYIAVSDGLGGFSKSGSVCTTLIRQSYEGIAQVIADRGMVFPLSSKAKQSGIAIAVDGGKVEAGPETWRYDEVENAVVFTGAAPKHGALVEVTYAQKEDDGA